MNNILSTALGRIRALGMIVGKQQDEDMIRLQANTILYDLFLPEGIFRRIAYLLLSIFTTTRCVSKQTLIRRMHEKGIVVDDAEDVLAALEGEPFGLWGKSFFFFKRDENDQDIYMAYLGDTETHQITEVY